MCRNLFGEFLIFQILVLGPQNRVFCEVTGGVCVGGGALIPSSEKVRVERTRSPSLMPSHE
jgi:hypothetical protein